MFSSLSPPKLLANDSWTRVHGVLADPRAAVAGSLFSFPLMDAIPLVEAVSARAVDGRLTDASWRAGTPDCGALRIDASAVPDEDRCFSTLRPFDPALTPLDASVSGSCLIAFISRVAYARQTTTLMATLASCTRSPLMLPKEAAHRPGCSPVMTSPQDQHLPRPCRTRSRGTQSRSGSWPVPLSSPRSPYH